MNKNYLLSKENAYKSEQYFYNSINRMAQSIVIDTIEKTQTGTSRYRYVGDDPKTITLGDLTQESTRYTGSRATLYANGQAVATNRSASQYDNGRAYFGTDILGSVRSATDDYATLEDRYEYDIFGTPYEGDFTSGLNNGYTGKPYDTTTGLYNYGYRDYSPQQARFTTVDPIRDGNNWFSYVVNDPVNYVDLWGLFSFANIFDSISTGFDSVVNTISDSIDTFFDIINVPSKEEHWGRNDHQKGMTYQTKEEAIANEFTQLGSGKGKSIDEVEKKDRYHEMGGQTGNDKYIRIKEGTNESYELVFDEDGNLVTNSINAGTYNFYHADGTPQANIGHFFNDMVPYYIWGNDEIDGRTTTVLQRIFGFYKGEIPEETSKCTY